MLGPHELMNSKAHSSVNLNTQVFYTTIWIEAVALEYDGHTDANIPVCDYIGLRFVQSKLKAVISNPMGHSFKGYFQLFFEPEGDLCSFHEGGVICINGELNVSR